MLVLSRKLGEKVTIQTSDGPIEIAVLVKGSGLPRHGKVRIGIDAPRQCIVMRNEIMEVDGDGRPSA